LREEILGRAFLRWKICETKIAISPVMPVTTGPQTLGQ